MILTALNTLWAENGVDSRGFLEVHSRELTTLILSAMVLGTLLFLVPRLLRAWREALQMRHVEHMKALEQGLSPTRPDVRSVFAGRTASLVPMVVTCAAGAVTCFLYNYDNLFSVALVVWSVAGVVSLAAITGGVALMGRLAQLSSGEAEDEPPQNPLAS